MTCHTSSKSRKSIVAFILLITNLLAPACLLASGTRGNAFVATAVYYNPAGLTQLRDQQSLFSLYGVSQHSEYSGTLGEASLSDSCRLRPGGPQSYIAGRGGQEKTNNRVGTVEKSGLLPCPEAIMAASRDSQKTPQFTP